MSDPKAILFDFEGTLVDFQWNLKEAIQETLEMLSVSGFPTDRLRGRKYSTLMTEAMKIATEMGRSSQAVRKKIETVYDRFDEDALTRWHLRPEAKDFLKALRARGVKRGLVSNVGRRALEKAFEKWHLRRLFDVTVSRNDVQTLKPSGEGLSLALSRLQVNKEKVLYVGDSLDDIHAAKEAGLKVIIIQGGEDRQPELLSGRPDALIRNFGVLLGFLEER